MSVWFDDEYTGRPIKDRLANVGVPHLVASPGGGAHVNPEWDHQHHTEGQAGPDGWTDAQMIERDSYPVWVCSACGHRSMNAHGKAFGDEYVDLCPECHSMESMSVRRVWNDTSDQYPTDSDFVDHKGAK